MTKNHITEVDVTTTTSDSMSVYAKETLIERAFINAFDGLKPLQRRIVYTMYAMGLMPNSQHKKGARVVGETMGKYHPHGDSSISGAMIKLSEEWSKRLTLVDVQGNNGSIDGSPAAADRYIEVRLAKAAGLLVENINKDVVDMVHNFDDTEIEPAVLPARLPYGIIAGTSGIALGYSSSILPHNPIEIMDALIAMASDKNITIEQLSDIIKGPDFPTGGILIDSGNLADELVSGRASYKMRAKIILHEDAKRPHVEITELTFGTKSEKFVETIGKVFEPIKQQLKVVSVENDDDDLETLSIRIYLKAGSKLDDLKKVEALIYKKTLGATSLRVEQQMVIKGRTACLGIAAVLREFLEFRRVTLKRLLEFELREFNQKYAINVGLIKLANVVDKVVEIAKASESKADMIAGLKTEFDFTDSQASHIASMSLYRLGKSITSAIAGQPGLEASIASHTNLLKNDDLMNKYLLKDLKDTKLALGEQPRRTKIVKQSEINDVDVDITPESTINEKDVMVIVKRDLVMFQMGVRAYQNQIDKYKDDDIVAAINCKNTEYVVGITSDGDVVTRFVNDLPGAALESRLDGLNKEISTLKVSANFVAACVPRQNDTNKLVIVTANGYMKVVQPTKLMPNVNRKTYIKKLSKAINLKSDNDSVIIAESLDQKATGQIEVTLRKANGNNVVKKLDLVKFLGRSDSATSAGFKGLNTKDGELSYVSHNLVN